MKVLIACEESQTECMAFRELGHEAYSCDIQEPSGGHPEWHILGDALEAMKGGQIVTMDGIAHDVGKWDMMIAHPPCTYLTVTGNKWFNVERLGEKAIKRHKDRQEAAEFFMALMAADIDKIAVENPIGYMSTYFRKPDQIVHPYYFAEFDGDENCERKATCLWLKNLQPLEYKVKFRPRVIEYKNGKGTDSPWHVETMKLPPAERAKARSKSFPGIAKAMAEQWGADMRKVRTDDI